MDNAVRAALRNGSTPPPWDDSTEAAWLFELAGTDAALAQRALECAPGGEPAFRRLRSHWDNLSPGCRSWLLRWGQRCEPVLTLELLERALTEQEPSVQLVAADVIGQMGVAAAVVRPLLEPLLKSQDLTLCIAAARAGGPGGDWREWALHGELTEIRLVGISRMSEEDGERCIPDLNQLLLDPDWQVRSAAAEALAHFVDQAADHVRSLLNNDDPVVRVSAARVLLALGRDEWLHDDLRRS